METPDALSPLALEALALEMLSQAAVRQTSESGAPPWLERAREYIHDHAADPARVTDVAEAVGVHPVHLARVFRRRLRLSPGEYLRRVRVRQALDLIARTGDGLARIAIRTGFCDQSELTKAFRRELGTTPSMYRRILRG
jgi:AraC family transcriptional regulator